MTHTKKTLLNNIEKEFFNVPKISPAAALGFGVKWVPATKHVFCNFDETEDAARYFSYQLYHAEL